MTNEEMKNLVETNGGKAVILPDRIPKVPLVEPVKLRGRKVIAYICTFSEDEPYEEVIEAAGFLEADIVVYITGNHRDRIDMGLLPSNVELTGFIDEQAYWSLLASADAVMVLTTRDGCLVCGAYETVALGRPLILSDTKVLRSYFNRGSVYVTPDSRSISEGIRETLKKKDELRVGIRDLRRVIYREWQDVFLSFQEKIQKL